MKDSFKDDNNKGGNTPPHVPGEQPTANLKPYPTTRQNEYPIVLVHGVGGFGRDEMNGFHYWGGKGDIQEFLTGEGYTTYTASMGPLSSNWDRAVELYYNIVGGTVDYGAVHSMHHGHARYGETFPGLYPEWSASNKIHLIGHSMGGPTGRFLIHLLENGDAQEMAYVPQGAHDGPTSDLFKGGKTNWVCSHTTVAGPNNGVLTSDWGEFRQWALDLILGLGAMGGIALEEKAVYDFDLGQWGLQRIPGETPKAYIDRVFGKAASQEGSAQRFWQSDDNCMYDLSGKASQLQNYYITSSPNAYYASYALDDMNQEANGEYIPDPLMSNLLKKIATPIGKTTADLPLGYTNWRPCDGLISVASAQYPIGHDYIFMDTLNRKLAPKGVWDVHPVVKGQDHLSIVTPDDKKSTIESLYQFYLKIATDISCLPK